MPKKIIVVGGGAGGLELATRLGKKLGKRHKAEITLVDKSPYHIWKPLLHEVATGIIDEHIDAVNYLTQARNNYFNFRLGKFINLDRQRKTILLDVINDDNGNLIVPKTELKYDYLVLAIGSVSNDFGTPGVKENCIFLDDIKQSKSLYNRLVTLLLKSYYSEQRNKIKVSIIGAGATGVELAAQLFNIINQLKSYIPNDKLISNIMDVTLIEASPRILPALPERISQSCYKILADLGIKILTGTAIIKAEAAGFTTKDNKFIAADLMVWSAGVKGQEFLKNIGGLETNRVNQIVVKDTLQTSVDDNILVLGDCAACAMPGGGFVPPRAQAAHQMANCVKQNIIYSLKKKKLKTYVYKDYGSLISLSKFGSLGILTSWVSQGSFIVEGWLAKVYYVSLYRLHQIALLGYVKTALVMLIGFLSKITKTKIKLH